MDADLQCPMLCGCALLSCLVLHMVLNHDVITLTAPIRIAALLVTRHGFIRRRKGMPVTATSAAAPFYTWPELLSSEIGGGSRPVARRS